MTKKISLLFLLAMLLAGCGHAVRHTVTPEYYRARPRTVAVLPVVWEEGATEARSAGIDRVFNGMVAEKVRSLGYTVIAVDEKDERVMGADGKGAPEVAKALGAQAVMYSRITGWDADTLVTYASLSLNARFELYYANGEKLWEAEFEKKESDLRLDRKPLKLAIIETYEPKVQRFIDIVFSTLPRNETPRGPEKRFFDWLP